MVGPVLLVAGDDQLARETALAQILGGAQAGGAGSDDRDALDA